MRSCTNKGLSHFLTLLILQLALGSILRDTSARDLPCGVFGSFGWSGEAVDEMESKLKDGGYGFAFKPIKVKFKPTATVSACRPDCGNGWIRCLLDPSLWLLTL